MTVQAILLLLTLGSCTQAYNILVFYPSPPISHQRAIMALTERLVQKGHKMYVISPINVPGLVNENYTFVDISFPQEKFESNEAKNDTHLTRLKMSKWEFLDLYRALVSMIKGQFLSKPFLEFQRRVRMEKLKFDLVIMENIYNPFTCAMTRLFVGNIPIIGMTTLSYDGESENEIGSIHHLSYMPSLLNAYTDKMGLWQKMENWLSAQYLGTKLDNLMEDGARTFFRDNYAAEHLVDNCRTNVSLVLVASNFLYFYPRLLAPNVIELGPLHIKPPEKLPKNLQDWLDGAEKGVIYFSLGSNVRSEHLPEDGRSNFLKFFTEMPKGYRVLWKLEPDGDILGHSQNILAQKWMPQESILAHSKVKVFITQGGLQSFQETVHYGVPTVGIPWFGDQECNVAKMADAQIGVRLGYEELASFHGIKLALETVLYNDSYSKNMKKLSAISHDFTSQALDKAVFWVEHVARHGGATHLRPSTADTTYFQFFCLDIISVILAIGAFILFILYSVCKCFILNFCQKSNSKIKTS